MCDESITTSSQAAGMQAHERLAYRSFVSRTQIARSEVEHMDGVVNARSLKLPGQASAGIGIEFQVTNFVLFLRFVQFALENNFFLLYWTGRCYRPRFLL